jgi:signal peptidase
MVIAHIGTHDRPAYDLLRQIKINHPSIYTTLVGKSQDLDCSALEKEYIDEYFCLPQFETILRRAQGTSNPTQAKAPTPNNVLLAYPLTQKAHAVSESTFNPIFPSEKQLSRVSHKKRGYISQAESQVSLPPEKGQEEKKAAGFSFVRLLGNIAFGFLMIIMAVMAFLMVQSKIIGEPPSIAGYQMFVVVSGSMSPSFDTGSLVFARSMDPMAIEAGDIITFKGASNNSMLTTHRVVHVNTEGGLNFTTRGDANNVNDPNPVPADRVVGKVHGSVPYLGYVLGFAQTRQGLILLIFIPGLLVIVYELRNILKYMVEDKKKQAEAEDTA